MTTGGQHGGYRRPTRPAAVSGPGALSQRTDGGPSDRQPIRVASGGAYGQRKAAEEQQAAAPMAAGGPRGAPPGGAPAPAMDAGADPGVFGLTARPNESITTGVGGFGNQVAETPDPDMVLRQLVLRYPTPWLLKLLRRRG